MTEQQNEWARRVDAAHAHEAEMLAKWCAILGYDKGYNYHLWYRKAEDASDGCNNIYDYPKAYSSMYERVFVERYFSKGSENNLTYHLNKDFVGDEIDAQYIESLIIKVKDYGLCDPGAMLILDCDGVPGCISCYSAPPPGSYYTTDHTQRGTVFIGSKLNKERIKAIRRWLKHQAKSLATNAVHVPAVPAAPQQTLTRPPRRDMISDWTGLLTQPEIFGLAKLVAAFHEVNLLGADGLPTEWGRTCQGEWAGAIEALTDHKPALLTVNARAAARCLKGWGIELAENTLRNNASAGAENVYKAMKTHLETIKSIG